MIPYNDEPTLADKFERHQLVREVGDFLAAKCPAPYVLGVHGDWGAGKTSFLQQLQWYLTGECPQRDVVAGPLRTTSDEERRDGLRRTWDGWAEWPNVTTVWFEAWRHQHAAVPVVALLHEIRLQLPFAAKALRKTGKLAEVTVRSSLIALEGISRHIGVQAAKVQDVGERWERDHLETPLPSHAIRQQLESALSGLLGHSKRRGEAKAKPRLVVLIDDLDRCDPEAAYRLLEGIKIYLNLRNCVFVLGMNQQVIESAIAKHLSDEKDAVLRAHHAREYMEKLCQHVVQLPLVCEPDTYLRDLCEGDRDDSVRRAALDGARKYRVLPANPRQIKAFANVLERFLGHVASGSRATGRDPCRLGETALLMAGLHAFHHDIYRLLEGDPGAYQQLLVKWVERPSSGGAPPTDEHPVFKGLRRVEQIGVSDDGTMDRSQTASSLFPDPARGYYFRLQPLVRRLNDLTDPEIEGCLLGRRTGS